MVKHGKVYLVGAGPGKPDLITVRGLRILEQADVIIHDYLASDVLPQETEGCPEVINCGSLKSGKDPSRASLSRLKKITDLTIEKALEGKMVVRLKNGDPSLFGRLADEVSALDARGIEYEIVPGVTAGSAAASSAGIPLTDREKASSCMFVTGKESPGKQRSAVDWKSAASSGTVVVYMGVSGLAATARKLTDSGMDPKTPALVISRASLPGERMVKGTLADIAAISARAKIEAPAILAAGEAVLKHGKEGLFRRKTKRILFTGLSPERFCLSGDHVHVPMIRIVPAKGYAGFDRALSCLDEYDWIVFTSRYGVEYFFRRLRVSGVDVRSLSSSKIAAVGASTAGELLKYGLLADLIPEDESSRGLAREFSRIGLNGKRILMPRSHISDKGLAGEFRRMGAEVKDPVGYRNVMPKHLPEIDLASFDEIMFTSPSTVRNFKKRYKTLPKKVVIRCIGEVTLNVFRKEFGKTRRVKVG